jgi:hypothetical protein
MGVPEHPDPAQLRISDTDRHKVAEILREAAGEGRLDLEELDERLEAAYGAKVYGELVPLLADLPAQQDVPMPRAGSTPVRRPGSVPVHATRHDTSFAVMGSQDRAGVWEIGPTHTAFTLMGGIRLDLRQAVFGSPEVVVNANAVMGSVDIVVNAATRVAVDGVGVMGDFSQTRDKVEPQVGADSPLVRVKGIALMGSVCVVRKAMPGENPRPGWRRR